MISNRRNMRGLQGQGRRKNQKLVLNQLAWLLVNNRQGVIGAFRDAGFEVDDDASPRKLKGILRRAVLRLREKRSPKAKALIRNISALILVEQQEKSSQFSNFFNRDKKKGDSKEGDSKEGEKEGEASDKEKGQFLKDNADTIGQIGASLLGGLFNRSGNEQVDSQMQTYQNQQNMGSGSDNKSKSKTGLIIGIGVVGLLAIGVTAYLIKKNK